MRIIVHVLNPKRGQALEEQHFPGPRPYDIDAQVYAGYSRALFPRYYVIAGLSFLVTMSSLSILGLF